jgi:hypothetical protein
MIYRLKFVDWWYTFALWGMVAFAVFSAEARNWHASAAGAVAVVWIVVAGRQEIRLRYHSIMLNSAVAKLDGLDKETVKRIEGLDFLIRNISK